MKEEFIPWEPNDASRLRLQQIVDVLEQYQAMKIRLTLRQLYYQLVSRNIIENTHREYKNLGNLLSRARLGGWIDWEMIEDRVRQAERAPQWDSVQDLARSAANQFRLPRWKNQPLHLELWCEKDALSSVLEPICREYHVTFMVNRGYSSSSAMYESSKRIREEAGERGALIVYLGDFDPSGEDMVRDIKDRLHTFETGAFEVIKLALTAAQVSSYKLPPNPLKRDAGGRLTDSRGAGFQAAHGNSSYEVDALPPDALQNLVRRAITGVMDMKKYRSVVAEENRLRSKLLMVAEGIA